jgi:hypothetical protein
MVIKGTACAGARRLAVHLLRTDTNERAEVAELRGVVAEDLPGALREMEAVASGARTTKPFYHSSINTRADERLTDEQRTRAIDRLEAELGLSGQPRVIVIHSKEGREHCHIVWSRIDLERMAAISDSHNFRKHELVARDLEREFGHERVQGAHVEREGRPRPQRTPSHAEMLQAERTGLSPQEVKDRVTDIWRRTDNGAAFAIALWHDGFALCRGDRRDFVVIDPSGGVHSLARRVEGARMKDIRARLADLDPAYLPRIADGRAMQLQRRDHDLGHDKVSKPDAIREPARDKTATATADRGRTHGTPEGPGAHARAADGFGRAASAMLDGIASLFERGLSGGEAQGDQAKSAPEPEPDTHEIQAEATVRTDEEQRAKQRQELLRKFAREIDSDISSEHDPGRERSR